ncbi:MAG: hypothetical protein ACFB2Z_00445 [Maricaulaceae bacterium]
MNPPIQIKLTFKSDSKEPDYYTTFFGAEPDFKSVKHSKHPEQNLPDSHIWTLRSKVGAHGDDVDAHWQNLKNYVQSIFQLQQIAPDTRISITIIVDASERIPAIVIPPDFCLLAGQLGIEIVVDCEQ